MPGIRCENGRLAPINDPDWIKFTDQMIAVARKTYKASQSRSQDAVSEATGDLVRRVRRLSPGLSRGRGRPRPGARSDRPLEQGQPLHVEVGAARRRDAVIRPNASYRSPAGDGGRRRRHRPRARQRSSPSAAAPPSIAAWPADEQQAYLLGLSEREAFHVAETPAGDIVGYQSLDRYSPILSLDGARRPARHVRAAGLAWPWRRPGAVPTPRCASRTPRLP